MTHLSPAKTLPAPSALLLVPLTAIDVGRNVRTRFPAETLKDLAESLKANGQAEPVLLRPTKKPGRYELIAGERRVRAAKLAGLTHVHAIAGDCDDARRLRLQLAENLDREDLAQDDVARLVKDLYDREGTLAKVAAVVKRSVPWVSKHLAATTRFNWRTRSILDRARCEDLELLGALNQLEELDNAYPRVLDRGEFDAAAKRVETGKITREELRKLVADAKAAKKIANAKEKEKIEKRTQKSNARKPAEPKPPTPEDLAQELLDFAGETVDLGTDDLKREFARHDPQALAAAESSLRAEWERGVHLRETGTPVQKLEFLMYGYRSRDRQSSSFMAGFAGVPFGLEHIGLAIAEAGRIADGADTEPAE